MNDKTPKNYGLKSTFDEARERLEGTTGTEYIYGAVEKDLASVPKEHRLRYAPDGVVQHNNVMDTNGCASRSPIGVYKAKYTYFYHNGMHPVLKEWLKGPHIIDGKPYSYLTGEGANTKVVFDETFIEIKSGTTPKGNSLKAPIHETTHGLIPECLPLEDGMTWEQYMNPKRITKDMEKLAKEFMRRFGNNYEQVPLSRFAEALEDDYLCAAGHGWGPEKNGVYQRTEAPFNHAFALLNWVINALDSYVPFIKTLAKNYKFFEWGYSLSITRQNPFPDETLSLFEVLQRNGLLSFFADAVKRLTDYFSDPQTAREPEPTPPPTTPPAPEPTPQPASDEKLIAALIQVESEGNDWAIGDKNLANKAYGPLQIRKPVCDDINNALGTAYVPQRCLGDRALSIKLFREYMKLWATEKKLGRPVTDQDRARIWNGGPTGWKRPSTALYWSKVLKHLSA